MREKVIKAIESGYETSKDIAKHLDASLPSVRMTLNRLLREGYVTSITIETRYSVTGKHEVKIEYVYHMRCKEIIDLLSKGEMTAKEISAKLYCSDWVARKTLNSMSEEGTVVSKKGRWGVKLWRLNNARH